MEKICAAWAELKEGSQKAEGKGSSVLDDLEIAT